MQKRWPWEGTKRLVDPLSSVGSCSPVDSTPREERTKRPLLSPVPAEGALHLEGGRGPQGPLRLLFSRVALHLPPLRALRAHFPAETELQWGGLYTETCKPGSANGGHGKKRLGQGSLGEPHSLRSSNLAPQGRAPPHWAPFSWAASKWATSNRGYVSLCSVSVGPPGRESSLSGRDGAPLRRRRLHERGREEEAHPVPPPLRRRCRARSPS